MFSICPKKVYQNNNLTALDIRVYLSIQGFANDDGYCFPSVARIADICGVSRRAVFYSLAKLEAEKIIAREKRLRDDGGYSSNAYYLKLEPDSGDVQSFAQGGVQSISLPSETECTSNKNQLRRKVNLKFTNSARVGARENSRIISTDDVARVCACRSSVRGAANYEFFISKGGEVCARAFSQLYQDSITESEILRFFENQNQNIRIFEPNFKTLEETKIE